MDYVAMLSTLDLAILLVTIFALVLVLIRDRVRDKRDEQVEKYLEVIDDEVTRLQETMCQTADTLKQLIDELRWDKKEK